MLTVNESTSEAYKTIVECLSEQNIQSSRAGDTREHLGVMVQSENPRKRLFNRDGLNLAFQLQEAIAYWTGQNPGHVQRYNSNMKQYMTDGKLEGSAYGRYLRRIPHDQISRVIEQLRENRETRQAVMNFHQAGVERYDGPDVACTIYLQFIIRDGALHCFANMRSQDMLWGYPYDVHNFQWIQEVLAGILDVELGSFTHYMNSCHYYVEHEDKILQSLDDHEPIEFPDIRLQEEELNYVMTTMTRGLKKARDGRLPHGEIMDLGMYSSFYADWLRFMTVYEQRRFYDDTCPRLYTEINFLPFRDFLS